MATSKIRKIISKTQSGVKETVTDVGNLKIIKTARNVGKKALKVADKGESAVAKQLKRIKLASGGDFELEWKGKKVNDFNHVYTKKVGKKEWFIDAYELESKQMGLNVYEKNGNSQFPIYYGNGRVGWDMPQLVPPVVQKAVRNIYVQERDSVSGDKMAKGGPVQDIIDKLSDFDLDTVNSVMSNDENSSDEEMIHYLVDEVEMSKADATKIIKTYRGTFFKQPLFQIEKTMARGGEIAVAKIGEELDSYVSEKDNDLKYIIYHYGDKEYIIMVRKVGWPAEPVGNKIYKHQDEAIKKARKLAGIDPNKPAANPLYVGQKVYLGFYRKRFVVVDEGSHQLWANEFFKTKEDVLGFVKSNKFKLVSDDVVEWDKKTMTPGGKPIFPPAKYEAGGELGFVPQPTSMFEKGGPLINEAIPIRYRFKNNTDKFEDGWEIIVYRPNTPKGLLPAKEKIILADIEGKVIKEMTLDQYDRYSGQRKILLRPGIDIVKNVVVGEKIESKEFESGGEIKFKLSGDQKVYIQDFIDRWGKLEKEDPDGEWYDELGHEWQKWLDDNGLPQWSAEEILAESDDEYISNIDEDFDIVVDGDHTTRVKEFLETNAGENVQPLAEDEIAAIKNLKPGESAMVSCHFGAVDVRRPAEGEIYERGGKTKTKYWIKDAIAHPGALRQKAMKQGLLKDENDTLSVTDLKKLEAEGGKTAEQAHLAQTLENMHNKMEGGGTTVAEITHGHAWKGGAAMGEDVPQPVFAKGGVAPETPVEIMNKVKARLIELQNSEENQTTKKTKLAYDIDLTGTEEGQNPALLVYFKDRPAYFFALKSFQPKQNIFYFFFQSFHAKIEFNGLKFLNHTDLLSFFGDINHYSDFQFYFPLVGGFKQRGEWGPKYIPQNKKKEAGGTLDFVPQPTSMFAHGGVLEQSQQLYRVKNKDGYLQSFGADAYYTRGEAVKKSKIFDGKVEPANPKFAISEKVHPFHYTNSFEEAEQYIASGKDKSFKSQLTIWELKYSEKKAAGGTLGFVPQPTSMFEDGGSTEFTLTAEQKEYVENFIERWERLEKEDPSEVWHSELVPEWQNWLEQNGLPQWSADEILAGGNYADGGTLSQPIPQQQIENQVIRPAIAVEKTILPENVNQNMAMAKGGEIPRIANSDARLYSENKLPFEANNMEGKTLDNGDYLVISWGYYPIWWYSKKENQWYGNADKYSKTTLIHISQAKPTHDAKMISVQDMFNKMREGDVKYDMGGHVIKQLYPMSTDNTTIAHTSDQGLL